MAKRGRPRKRPLPIEQPPASEEPQTFPPPIAEPPKRGPAPGATYQMDPPVVPKPPPVGCPKCGSTIVTWRANKVRHPYDGRVITWQRIKCECGQVRIEKGEEPL